MHHDLLTILIDEHQRALRSEADRRRTPPRAARAGPRFRFGPLRDRAGAALVRLGLRLATPPAAAALRDRR